MNRKDFLKNRRDNWRAAKTSTLTWIIVIGLFGAVALGYLGPGVCQFVNNKTGCILGPSGASGSPTPTASSLLYGGLNWQTVSGATGGTPAAVAFVAYASGAPGQYWIKTAASAATQYTSSSALFGFSPGVCFQLYSTSAYPAAECDTSSSSASGNLISGLPGYSDSVQQTGCVANSQTYNCINFSPTYPNTYTNTTTSVSAFAATLIPSFSGTTIPTTTFTLTYNFAGVSGRGGGIGNAQLASGTILGGVPNQAVCIYSNGNCATAGANQIVASQSACTMVSNQTSQTLNSVTSGSGTSQPGVAQAFTSLAAYNQQNVLAWGITIGPSATTLSSAANTPQYLQASLIFSFTNNGITTGKHVFYQLTCFDNQQPVGFDWPKFTDGSGITSSQACTSSATTQGCDNSSDIVAGTFQNIAGVPVAQGGGGSGSATAPNWFTPTTGPNAGWGTFAGLRTLSGGPVVYGT